MRLVFFKETDKIALIIDTAEENMSKKGLEAAWITHSIIEATQNSTYTEDQIRAEVAVLLNPEKALDDEDETLDYWISKILDFINNPGVGEDLQTVQQRVKESILDNYRRRDDLAYPDEDEIYAKAV